MRRLALAIATLWLLAVAVIGFSAVANAAPIPSGASGVYIAPDRVCRIVFSRYQTHWIQLDLACLPFNAGQTTHSLTTLWAPGGACPVESIAWNFNPWPPGAVREYVSIRAVLPDRLEMMVGTDVNAVSNGAATPQTWLLVQPVASPAPYTCVAPTGERKGIR